MNDDIKLGYNIACNGLNDDIDTLINELLDAHKRQTDERIKDRFDAQTNLLWSFKSRIEDCVAKDNEEQDFCSYGERMEKEE